MVHILLGERWEYSNFKLSFSFWFLNAEIWEETGLLVCEYLFEGIKGGVHVM